MTRSLLLIALLLGSLTSSLPVRAFDIVDQEKLGSSGSISFKLFSLAQSFTPAFSSLSFVSLRLGCCDAADPGPALVRVDIRSGGIAGPVVASSSAFSIAHGSPGAFISFAISPPIATTPGATYVVELVQLSGGNGFWSRGSNSYPGGISFVDGTASPTADLLFRTGVISDEPPQLGGGAPPVEYSNALDEQALPGGGQGPADPGQVLYTEPPDDAANSLPADVTDFFPLVESGNEPDLQVDALAHGVDYLFVELAANQADLVISVEGDTLMGGASSEVGAMIEDTAGLPGVLYTHTDLDTSDSIGVVEDVDGLDLWGPLGAGDAFYYSLKGDSLTGTSVYYWDGVTSSVFLSQSDVFSVLFALGFSGSVADVDVDALMVRNIGTIEESELGDEILFSIRAVPSANFDGGEIMRMRIGGTPSFLSHGGHHWDTAFDVRAAFGSTSEDVDAIEAAPAPLDVPALGPLARALLPMVLAVSLVMARRRQAHVVGRP